MITTKTTKTVRTTTTVKNTDGSTTITVVETVTEGGEPEPEPQWVKEATERFKERHRNSKPWRSV